MEPVHNVRIHKKNNMLQIHFDRLAIALSGICAIHCVIFPVVAGFLPLLATTLHHGNTLHEFWFHQFILLFILPVSILALITGYRCHKQLTPLLIGGLGLLILVFIAIFAGTLISNNIIPHQGETWLTVAGGFVHAIGHVLNVLATRNNRISCPT